MFQKAAKRGRNCVLREHPGFVKDAQHPARSALITDETFWMQSDEAAYVI